MRKLLQGLQSFCQDFRVRAERGRSLDNEADCVERKGGNMEVIVLIVNGLLYSGIIVGLLLCFEQSFRGLLKAIKLRRGLSARSRQERKKDPLEVHMDMLMQVSLGGRISGSTFMYLSTLLFIAVAATGMKTLSVPGSLLIGFVAASMPYMIFRVRLESIRKRTSFEGENFVGNLLAAYRICDCNVYAAMEKMSESKNEAKNSVKLLMRLLYEFRTMRSSEEAKKAADRFAYAINTNWGRMLAYDLRIAAVKGTDISVAIEDMLIQLREARVAAEERKRLNGEAMRMVVFMVPISYIFTVFISLRYLGVTFKEFFANQLFSQQGFLMFAVMIALFFINLVLLEAVNNKRFDY